MTNLNKKAISLSSILIVVFIIASVFLAYSDALNNQFLMTWDTQEYVVFNAHIQAFTWENIWWMLTNVEMINWHPLTWFSHALDYALFGLDPWGHHFVNILIHAFNSILIFVLVIVFMSFREQAIDNKILLTAGVAALLFGIHPQHVESVVWIAERKDVLCLFFILLTFISYVFYVEKLRRSWYALTLLCFILALLSKPMAVTIPVILLLMDIYPLNRTPLTASTQVVSYQKLLIEKIPFFACTVFTIVITLFVQQKAMFPIEGLGILSRILNAFNTIFFYIAKFIFPVSLSPYYPLNTQINDLEHYKILIPIIAAVFTTILCVYLWVKKQSYYLMIAWLFYLITLSPVVGIIQVGGQSAADRYVYLPTIPFYILLGLGFSKLLYAPKISKYIKYGSVVGVLFISVLLIQLTQKQGKIWKNDLIFWVYAAEYTPDSGLLQYRVGNVYFMERAYEKALEHYKHAIYLVPTKSKWYPPILRSYLILNQFDKALAFMKPPIGYSIDIGLTREELYYIEGWIYQKQGLLDKAHTVLVEALATNPDLKKAQDLLLKVNANIVEHRIPRFRYTEK
ncbi:MAG: hypothetical protein KAH77_03755 [Thiomargarita sp.]|nr:hypothetical protein [Thiomargarita sp.]